MIIPRLPKINKYPCIGPLDVLKSNAGYYIDCGLTQLMIISRIQEKVTIIQIKN